MVAGGQTIILASLISDLWIVFKAGVLVFAVFYFIFSLFVLRQVNLMTETVSTGFTPVLKGLAIIYAGVSLGIIVLLIGFLFGR